MLSAVGVAEIGILRTSPTPKCPSSICLKVSFQETILYLLNLNAQSNLMTGQNINCRVISKTRIEVP